MEIKSELLYPYTEEERIDFIITQNHQLGYEIRYVEREIEEEIVKDIQAWGYTDEEKAEKEREMLNKLTLSRGDVFSALIQARMINEATLKEMIEAEMPETTDEEKMRKMLALNALGNALNFHRGHDLVNEIGAALNISQENLNLFFKTNDYHYLEAETNPTEI